MPDEEEGVEMGWVGDILSRGGDVSKGENLGHDRLRRVHGIDQVGGGQWGRVIFCQKAAQNGNSPCPF